MDFGKDALEATREMDEREATFELLDANGKVCGADEGKPVTLTIVGPDSKRVRAEIDAISQRLMVSRRTKQTPADLRANRIATAAAAVVKWENVEADGQPLPCTRENVRGMLSVPLYLRQVEEAVNDHAGFFTTP